jgi:hypothetical protein
MLLGRVRYCRTDVEVTGKIEQAEVEAESARDGPFRNARRWLPVALLGLGLLVALMFLAGVQAQGLALASHPPEAILKEDARKLQEGHLVSYCWGVTCADGFSKYPAAVRVDAGSRLRIRIYENERPDRVWLRSRPSPDGRWRRIDTALKRVKRDGERVVWDVSFRVNRPDRHYYLDVFGIWNDASGRAYGDAYWEFHLKTSP